MARDLFLGETARDWSCGGRFVDTTRPPWSGQPDAPTLVRLARAEVNRNAGTVIKLRRSGRLPEADWQDFRKFHRRWVDFYDRRRGRVGEADTLALWNFRKTNEEFTRKLGVLAELAAPGATSSLAKLPERPPPPRTQPWYVILGAALALAGVGIFEAAKTTKTKR